MAKGKRSKTDIHMLSKCMTREIEITRRDDLLEEPFSKPRLPDRTVQHFDVFGRRRHYDAIKFQVGTKSIIETDDSDGCSLIHSKNMKLAIDKTLTSENGTIRRTTVAPIAMEVLNSIVSTDTFCTTMTVREAAATLETICRDMLCEVKRITINNVIKLKVIRPGSRFGHPNTRRAKAYVHIKQYDKLRTDISINRLNNSMFFESASFNSLASDIRWRFQREWPHHVDALYVRVPA